MKIAIKDKMVIIRPDNNKELYCLGKLSGIAGAGNFTDTDDAGSVLMLPEGDFIIALITLLDKN